jgi:integrase/recombinase XerD
MFKEGVDQFYFNCRLKNLSVATLKCYGERLNDFYNFIQKKSVPFENVDRSVVQEYILGLKDKVSDYTLNGRLRVLKVFFNLLIKEGIWDGKPNPMEKVDYVRAEKKLKPVISVEEMEKILTVLNRRTFEGYRNYCMILVF